MPSLGKQRIKNRIWRQLENDKRRDCRPAMQRLQDAEKQPAQVIIGLLLGFEGRRETRKGGRRDRLGNLVDPAPEMGVDCSRPDAQLFGEFA